VILPTGKVAVVRIERSTVGNPALEQCIVARISTWQFPVPKGGGTVKVSKLFTFQVDR